MKKRHGIIKKEKTHDADVTSLLSHPHEIYKSGRRKPVKIYLETSVPNMLFSLQSREKREITERLFAQIQRGIHEAFVSALYMEEVQMTEGWKGKSWKEIQDRLNRHVATWKKEREEEQEKKKAGAA